MNRYIIIIMSLLIVSAAGCAKVLPRTAHEEGYKSAKALALETEFKRYAEKTNSIKALVWVSINNGEEERQTDAAFAIQRTNNFRADAMDQLADVWASVGSDGKRLWLFLPGKLKLYEGKATRANLHRLAKFDWEINELVAVLSGSAPLGENDSLIQAGGAKDGHFMDARGSLHLWIDAKTGRLSKVQHFGGDGSHLDYEVLFANYKHVEGVWFPFRIEARFPDRGAEITVLYRDVSFGGVIDPQRFLPPKSNGHKTIDLKDGQ